MYLLINACLKKKIRYALMIKLLLNPFVVYLLFKATQLQFNYKLR